VNRDHEQGRENLLDLKLPNQTPSERVQSVIDYYASGGWGKVAANIQGEDARQKDEPGLLFGHSWFPDGVGAIQYTPPQPSSFLPFDYDASDKSLEEWRRKWHESKDGPYVAAQSYIAARYSDVMGPQPGGIIPAQDGFLVPPGMLDDLKAQFEKSVLDAFELPHDTFKPKPVIPPTLFDRAWDRVVAWLGNARQVVSEVVYEWLSGRDFPDDDWMDD
jgi:hypothetical protein